MLVARSGHQTRLHDGSDGGCVIVGCVIVGGVIVGGGIGKPPNRQGAALFNQGVDLLNHGIASKAVAGGRLEFTHRRWQ